jgi:hypothetical protein
VTKGLSDGEMVVVTGQLAVHPGAKVRVETNAPGQMPPGSNPAAGNPAGGPPKQETSKQTGAGAP